MEENKLNWLEEKKLSEFGSRDLIVSTESKEAAEQDVRKLEIKKKYQRMILKGTMPERKKDWGGPFLDNMSRAALNVMAALIKASYRYETIRSIYLNEHLMCSYQLREKTEDDLKKDVLDAERLVANEQFKGDYQKSGIAYIKGLDLKREEVVKLISNFILDDLIVSENPAGKGFYNEDRRIPYFFDKEEKILMDVESDEFYFYVRDRYDIPKKDYDPEVKDRIRAHIFRHEKRIEAHQFAYFNKRTYTLYISDHDNGIYRLNGEHIEHVDNGADGIYFEFNSDFTPFNVDVENLEAINYFEKEDEVKFKLNILGKQLDINLGKRKKRGFSWGKFALNDSYLRRYLIDIANFAETEKNINATEQKILLVIYFYSLFFESLMSEKPIICFVGLKDSGKSTIGSLIGKTLFGEKYQCRHCPDNTRDLNTIIGENYYMLFDNVDHFVKSEIIDALCIAATGGTIEKRKLYTDREIVKIRPHVFLGITTRAAKFKRDDLISRLILFNNEKIANRIQKEKFYRDIEENRDRIMAEVLVNLNSIIELLKRQKHWSPRCSFRVADWETFGRKVCVGLPWGLYFKHIMEVMNVEKDKFALEDDLLYVLLEDRVINREEEIECLSASALYALLQEDAEKMKIKNFSNKYKSPISLGKRISNVQDELRRVFELEIGKTNHNVTVYSFRPLEDEEEAEKKKQEALERREAMAEAKRRAEEEAAIPDEVKEAKKQKTLEALRARIGAEKEAKKEEAKK
jgi:hypothetical protein